MDAELLGIIGFAVISFFLFVLVIGGVLAIIPLSIFLTKALAKSKWLRKFSTEIEEELGKERDGIEGFITISKIKEINDTQNARIDAMVIQNREIVEKLDCLIEQVEKWSGAGYE